MMVLVPEIAFGNVFSKFMDVVTHMTHVWLNGYYIGVGNLLQGNKMHVLNYLLEYGLHGSFLMKQ